VSGRQWRRSYQFKGDTASTGLANVDVEEDTATLGLCHFRFGVCRADTVVFGIEEKETVCDKKRDSKQRDCSTVKVVMLDGF
jgi:hypothetical protein